MGNRGRLPQRHMIDGQPMTVDEIADMLGTTKYALQCRRSRMGGCSYQVIVNMHREGQFGKKNEARYLIEGRWMSTWQIAEMLGVKPHTLYNWRWANKGKSMADAIAHFRAYQTGERQRYGYRGGGARPVAYRVGGHVYTVGGVAKKYGVTPQSVRHYMKKHGGDMAATLKHYREREKEKQRRAEAEIMKALGF